MSINIASNFDLFATLPLDARTVVATIVARDAIAAGQRYDGLSVYVLADNNTYQLQGGITNSDWKLVVTAGGALWVDGGTYISPLASHDVYTDGQLFIANGNGATPALAFFDDQNTGLYRLTSGGKTIMNWCIDSDIIVQIQPDRITLPGIVKVENSQYFTFTGGATVTGPAARIGGYSTLSDCRVLELMVSDPEVVDSGTSTAAGANTLTDGTKSWTVNEHIGKQVFITSGTGIRDYRTITANTATQITVSENFSGVPSGSGYRIEYKAVFYTRTEGGFFAGPTASEVDFPYSHCIISQDDSGYYFSNNKYAVIAENTASSSLNGIAVGGYTRISDAKDAIGVYGVCGNLAVGDTGDAVGVLGTVLTVRTLGNNIGIYASAGGIAGNKNYALYCNAGAILNSGRFLGKKGVSLVAANDLELTSGNYFEVSGNITINRILYTESGSTSYPDWTPGSVITLYFTGAPTVSHGVATSGAFVGLQLAGATDFSATAGDMLTLILDSTTTWWREISRTAI